MAAPFCIKMDSVKDKIAISLSPTCETREAAHFGVLAEAIVTGCKHVARMSKGTISE